MFNLSKLIQLLLNCRVSGELDEDQIRKYVRYQEEKDKVAEQLGLWDN